MVYDDTWWYLWGWGLLLLYMISHCYMMLYAVYVMLFTVFWRPVGFSTYIFGGGPLFPPARALNARARVGGNRPEDLDPKTGGRHTGKPQQGATTRSHNKEPQQGATTRSHNEEPQRGATTGPDRSAWPPVYWKQKGWKKNLWNLMIS